MAPAWLVALALFPGGSRPVADDEKAIDNLGIHPHRTGITFRRYDTDIDGEIVPQPSWASRIWSFIRQTDPEVIDSTDEDVYNPHYRKLPLVAGLLVPFAILMEIPGLTEHWYVRIDPVTHSPIEYRNNSKILEIGLAVSMASAVIANLSLISRFLEKHIRFSTILAMLFLTVHDILNIVTLAIYGYQGRIDDGFTYAQAYWSTVASTGISTITNVTLLIDFIRTKDFASSGSGLSRKQRSLVIIIILLFSWVAIGAGCFAALLNVTFQDALYFTIVTMETIGFGDIIPANNAGARIFAIIYIATAIFNLALAVTTIRDVVTEAIRHAATRRRRRATRNRLRRERRLAMELQNPMLIFHGGGRRLRVGDGGTGDGVGLNGGGASANGTGWGIGKSTREAGGEMLHAHAPHASAFGIMADAIREWFGDSDRHRSEEEDEEDEEALDAQAAAHYHNDEHVMIEDQHLLLPRAADPESDAEFHAEIARHDKQDRVLQVSSSSSDPSAGLRGSPSPPPPLRPSSPLWGLPPPPLPLLPAVILLGGTELAPRRSPSRSRARARARFRSWLQDVSNRLRIAPDSYSPFFGLFTNFIFIAFAVFILFWVLGAVIFKSTEGWGFGSAMYFCENPLPAALLTMLVSLTSLCSCSVIHSWMDVDDSSPEIGFIAFTTVGYGDLSPKTPAGRAIFTFWALLGVGGLTVFISIISEAYAGAFTSAVESEDARLLARLREKHAQARRLELAKRNEELVLSGAISAAAANEAASTLPTLEQFAADLIRHARTYHPHMRKIFGVDELRYGESLGGGGSSGSTGQQPSRKLKELVLEELSGEDARTQHIVMKNADFRKACFVVSYDRSFDQLMQSALAVTQALNAPSPDTNAYNNNSANNNNNNNTNTDHENTVRRPRVAPTRPGQTGTRHGGPPLQTVDTMEQDAAGSLISDLLQRTVGFDLGLNEFELDLSTADNYVDNHVVS
ncbi:hypothetical protein DL93DRAFT_2164886 [Clavulina sp. PMI_390]|nr:hypothetical protein DL93DRAFT_2164886 [Clavulina sp. PMI_390]